MYCLFTLCQHFERNPLHYKLDIPILQLRKWRHRYFSYFAQAKQGAMTRQCAPEATSLSSTFSYLSKGLQGGFGYLQTDIP